MPSISLDIKSELPTAIKWTNEHTRQLPFSISQALNASAQGSKFIPGSKQKSALNALAGSSRRFLDRPKPQTQKGFRATVANKRNLSVLITPRDKPFSRNRYLSGNILGGTRAPKDFEAKFSSLSKGMIPSGTTYSPTRFAKPVDRYGNVSRAAIDKMIKNVGNSGRTAGGNIFIGQPLRGERLAGVYRRERNHKLRPLFFANTPRQYQARFPAQRIAEQKVQQTFGVYLRQQLAKNVAANVRAGRADMRTGLF